MEQMLRTWTQPIPGSMETKPVFPANTTNVIENALRSYKASTLAKQRQPHGLPARPPLPGASHCPSWNTPPVNGPQFQPPPNAYPYSAYAQSTAYPQAQVSLRISRFVQECLLTCDQPLTQTYYQPPQPQPNTGYHTPIQSHPPYYPPTPQAQHFNPPQHMRPPDYARLHSDIEGLINSIQHKRAINPHDQSLNARLKAMVDLKALIQTTQPAPHEWDRIRDQVGLLVQQENSPPYNTHPYSHQPSTPTQFAQTPQPPPQPPTPSHAVNLQPQLAAEQSLAQLLAKLPQQQNVATPQNAPAYMPPPPPTLTNGAANATANVSTLSSGNNILDILRTSGLIPTPASNSRSTSTQPNSSAYAPPPVTGQPAPPPPVAAAQSSTPTVKSGNDLAALLSSLAGGNPDKPAPPVIELTTASIKISRPDLINRRLYSTAPSQCMTCGRRFPGTPEGKARKARHLDFHFRTKKRMAEADDAGRRGACRAWYVSEREWIKHREIDDADENAIDAEKAATASASSDLNPANGVPDGESKKQATPFVRVPDAELVQASERSGQSINICPICQEKFENRWHDAAQEWVWMDAVKSGGAKGRVYHASCYDEVRRDQERALQRKVAEGLATGKKRKMVEELVVGERGSKSPRSDE